MKIIIGLGNPGKDYEKTRHNVAWLFFDHLLPGVNWTFNKKWNALTYQEGGILFVKPQNFMNNSGLVARKALDFYSLLPKNLGWLTKKNTNLEDDLLVIQDELDLDFGKYKLSHDSNSAGHRGVQSIINHLKTKNFTRLRIGIKSELLRNPIPPDRFVMQRFSFEELNQLPKIFSEIKEQEKLI
ncbi:MAG: aminoacyl-tRNA hydrolase [Patescibacteria group bacterium]|jgi:PTH1 family peptidyl-tRNA hydrolase